MSEPHMYNRTQVDAIVAPLEQHIKELESRLGELTAENSRLGNELFERSSRLHTALEALSELVCLKDLKDKHGKTPQYLERQPAAWDDARAVLTNENTRNVGPCECGQKRPLLLGEEHNPTRVHVCDDGQVYHGVRVVEIHCRLCGKLCDRHLPGELVVWTCPECIKDLSVERGDQK